MHQGAHNCAASGEAASLRAEAVALYLLLDHTDPSQKLVALTDSLSLMLILDGWDRQDFIPRAEFQKHKDVIIPLAVKLASRSGETVLVKVKSHMGISLNEEADIEANKGLSSQEYCPALRPVAQLLLAPMDSNGCKISDFNSQIRQRVTCSVLDNLQLEGVSALITSAVLRALLVTCAAEWRLPLTFSANARLSQPLMTRSGVACLNT
eukprot:2221844-Rhodomonas_salina.3